MRAPKTTWHLPEWAQVLGVWLLWRGGLVLLAILADHFLAYKPSFPYFESILPSFGWPRWLYSWANFDGVHYLTIVREGYKYGLVQAFFPVFPLLIYFINQLTHLDALLSGLLLNQIGSFISCWLLWKWWKTELGERAARWGLAWWLLFPTAFFAVSFYTEGIFLALSIGCWLSAKQGKWWLAGGLAAVASATKVVGIWLVPLMLFELLAQTKWSWSLHWPKIHNWLQAHWSKLLAVVLGSVGLLSYMGYLWVRFHDPLFFLHQQSAFGAGRQESLVIWPQVVWRSWHILLTARPFDLRYLVYVQEFLTGVGSVLLVGLGWWKQKYTKLTAPLAIYSLGCLLMPTFTGTFSSLPRYCLAAWPIWLVLIAWSRTSRWAWLGVVFSLALLIINTVLFIQGYWMA